MHFNTFVSGRWVPQLEYRSFSPTTVNREWTWDDPVIHTLLERATQMLGELNRLLNQAHAKLMQSARGENKYPGEMRRSQNWLGGSGPSNAVYVPPHPDEVPDLMSDLEKFWHNESIHVPHLIRIAISHYQFESIHPYCDGNGRIGRLLIALYLVSKGLLRKPTLYLSAFLEKHRQAYFDALTRVRESNDLSHWVRFFLQAVLETAQRGCETFEGILSLLQEVELRILKLGRRAENARRLLDYLYKIPKVNANEAAELLEISHQRASVLLRDFSAMNILEFAEKSDRSNSYTFARYLKQFGR